VREACAERARTVRPPVIHHSLTRELGVVALTGDAGDRAIASEASQVKLLNLTRDRVLPFTNTSHALTSVPSCNGGRLHTHRDKARVTSTGCI